MRGNKKGALEASETGEWTLFVIAAVVLLVFVGAVYALLKGSSEDDLCKLSVLGRATSPVSSAQEVVPLKCVVKKVCFSDGRGNCDDPLRGEKGVLTVKIPRVEETSDSVAIDAAANVIAEESARRMYECWKTMGEGKLDLFNGVRTTFGIDPVSTTCVICSRLVVDKNVPEKVLERVDVNSFMKTHPVSTGSDVTYLQAFTGSKDVLGYATFNPKVFKSDASGTLDVEALKKYNGNVLNAVDSKSTDRDLIEEAKTLSAFEQKTANRELAFVFMQIKSHTPGEVVKNIATAGGVVVGSTFMTPVVRPVAKLATRFAFTPLGAVVTLGTVAGVGGYGVWNAYQGQLTSANYCGKFTTNENNAREGCSMVQGLNYNKDEVNALCASIQGRLYEN